MRLTKYSLGFLFASGILATSFHALASPPRCAPHQVLVDYLKEHYQEAVKAELSTPRGNAQILISDENGTWTFLVTVGTMSCVVRAGSLGVSV